MAYNRYRGNSGRAERVEDAAEEALFPPPSPPLRSEPGPPPPPPGPEPPPPPPERPPRPRSAGGELFRLLGRLEPGRLELEDFLVRAVLYLLYRETKDREFLIIMGAFLFL